ncbi:General transcription factor II-I repeat domain-containing protein 2 [Cucumispora dikerogammari]|nr:General transcription factor II-I repeat domain-containing protein 2 [Cucumispora dikerogammari]
MQDIAQLLMFIRGIKDIFEITEELLGAESLKDTTTGRYLFTAVENCVEKSELQWKNMYSVTTDGAAALVEKINLRQLVGNKIKIEHLENTLLSLHCIIHQKNLCKAALNIKHAIEPVVGIINIIRARELNHRQFKTLLEDLENKHYDVLYHNNVRWLSLSQILRLV